MNRLFRLTICIAVLGGVAVMSLFTCSTCAQNAEVSGESTVPQRSESTPDSETPTLRDFDPQPMLQVPRTQLERAKFPVVDVHTHFGRRLQGDRGQLMDYVNLMDANNIAISISFDAKLGDEDEHLKFISPSNQVGPQRIVAFVHLDFIGKGNPRDPRTWAVNEPDFVHQTVEQLKIAQNKGILGLKFFKSFGLTDRWADGRLLQIDDPHWDPIWKTCGELGLPIIMHVADPAAFFEAVDRHNERWEELSRHPDWNFSDPKYPRREELLAARNRVIARHPHTTFIGAHVANNSEDLATVGHWLDQYPNLIVEIASRINELGRQPYTARRFFIKYQDRILFGTDGPWPAQRLHYYWRFLETYDEYFPYSEKTPPPQGQWRIYGIGLPDEVLQKIYFQNACRVIPGLQSSFDHARVAN